jgi:hypothetical protein
MVGEKLSHSNEHEGRDSSLEAAEGIIGQAFGNQSEQAPEKPVDLIEIFKTLRQRVHTAAEHAQESVHDFRTQHSHKR